MFVSGYKPTGLLIFLRTLDDSTFLVWQHVSVREPAVPSPAVAIWRWFLAVLRDSMRLTDGAASCQVEDRGGSVGDLRVMGGCRESGRQEASVADMHLHIRSHLACY
jgi:hypothetical protein